jgi:hypothetical protein
MKAMAKVTLDLGQYGIMEEPRTNFASKPALLPVEITGPIHLKFLPLRWLNVKRAISLPTQEPRLQSGTLGLKVPLNCVSESLSA